MKKYIKLTLAAIFSITLFGCASTSEKAQKKVEEYNTQLSSYMESIAEYNTAAKARNESIQSLTAEINGSQDDINKEEKPFDPDTLTTLKAEMTKAQEKLLPEVEVLPEFEQLTVNDEESDKELKELINQADESISTMKSIKIPEDKVDAVDYSDILSSLTTARKAYKDSVQGLKQITAPSDEFVMDRIKRLDNILAIGAVTEDHDPNGKLNKAGGYIGTIYYEDSRIDKNQFYLAPGEDDVIDVGTQGGGAIEIYPDVESAEKRDTYLSAFDGSVLSNGAHHVYGTLVIRVSDELTASQQTEMTEKLLNVLLAVE